LLYERNRVSILLDEIIKDKRYKSLCNKLTKGSYIADDLYQDFILNCLERGAEYFEKRFDTYAETNKFCMGIISNSYRNKNRLTSSLFNTYYLEYKDVNEMSIEDEQVEVIEINVFDKLKNQNSLDVALLVTSKTVKNFKTFCKEANIDYRNADYRVQKLKQKIRNESTHWNIWKD